MGKGSMTTADYKTDKGYFVSEFEYLYSGEKMKFLIVPLKGFDGLFFYVEEQDNGMFRVTGEGYLYHENWSESMKTYYNEIEETKQKLNEYGRVGYFFIERTGEVTKKEWRQYSLDITAWILTDDSCCQYARKVERAAGMYELIEYCLINPETDTYEVYTDTIDVADYLETKRNELTDILESFGYSGIEDVEEKYGGMESDAPAQIIAECAFEYFGNSEARQVFRGSEAECREFIAGYIKTEGGLRLELKLNTGVCRILNVSMYETILAPEYIFENDDCEVESSRSLTEEEKDWYFNVAQQKFNSEKYRVVVAGYAETVLREIFADIGDKIKITLCGNAVIDSPVYYNYRTDELHFEIKTDESEINKIIEFTSGNKEFFKWAEQFKSYSGFISFMPYREEEYIKALNGKDIERALAMYLEYTVDEMNGFKKPEFGYDYKLYEKIRENHSLCEFIDDEKFEEILLKLERE